MKAGYIGVILCTVLAGVGGFLGLDIALTTTPSAKAHCIINEIYAPVDKDGKLSAPAPVLARCTIAEANVAWDAAAAQFGIENWNVSIGDRFDFDVQRRVTGLTHQELTGDYVFTNPKRM